MHSIDENRLLCSLFVALCFDIERYPPQKKKKKQTMTTTNNEFYLLR